jgi:hypothetical protein
LIFKHLGVNVFLINEIGFWWCALIIICKLGEEASSPWCGGIDVINQELEDGRRKNIKKSKGVDEKGDKKKVGQLFNTPKKCLFNAHIFQNLH